MKKINKEELQAIEGGTVSFNASYLTALYKFSTLLFEVGKELGSSIRRISTNSVCPLK